MKQILLSVFLYVLPLFQDGVEDRLLGKWLYSKGSYEYYDAANHKLKEAEMNGISGLEIQLNKDNTAMISFSKTQSRVTTYALGKNEGGKPTITAALRGNPFTYEILSITNTALVLATRTNTNFYIDGDVNKKASYCLVKIYLERKP